MISSLLGFLCHPCCNLASRGAGQRLHRSSLWELSGKAPREQQALTKQRSGGREGAEGSS